MTPPHNQENRALKRAASILKVNESAAGIPAAGPLKVDNYQVAELIVAIADRIDQIEKKMSQQDARSR